MYSFIQETIIYPIMQKLLVFLCCFALSMGLKAEIKTINLTLHFKSDAYVLNGADLAKIEKLLSKFSLESDFEIYVQGHTDAIGTDNYNEALALKRAVAVRTVLLQKGLPSNLVLTEAFGERKPQTSNRHEKSRRQNRRVEIAVKLYQFDNIEELEMALTANNKTSFTLNPAESNTVVGRQGVELIIEANSFLNEDGNPVKETVEVTLIEALNYEDFAAHNLATLSGNDLLVSDGMVRIEVKTQSGKTLKLNPNQPISAKIPTQNKDSRMQLFNSESGTDWELKGALEKDTSQTILFFDAPLFKDIRYVLEELPLFIPDFETKPKEPKRMGKPKTPRLPNELAYKIPLKWYQKPFATIIEKQQDDAYKQALTNYQKHQQLYQKRYDIYVEHNAEMPIKLKKHEVAVIAWKNKRTLDSVAFTSSAEYISIEARNTRTLQMAAEDNKRAWQAWNIERNKAIEEAGAKLDSMGTTSASMVDMYFTSFSKLSWINIDHFYKLPDNQARMVVLQDSDESPEKAFVVFKEIKSLLPLNRQENGDLSRDRFPKKERTALLAYKVEDGKTLVSYQNISPVKTTYQTNYKPYTFAELKQLLKEIQS